MTVKNRLSSAAFLCAASALLFGGVVILPSSAIAQTTEVVPRKPATDADAARLLQQATFGFSDADIASVKSLGYAGWINQQLNMPIQFSHVGEINSYYGDYPDVRAPILNETMWLSFVRPDQLRQRYMFALTQILVNSDYDGSTYYWGRSLAQYVDNLYIYGFGRYRNLIQQVTLNPAMGNFLSHIYNRKEDPRTGAQPDQNYARELMQLFSIGLYELNQDGSRKLDGQGQPIPTYSTADVIAISKILTGWAPKGATDNDWDQFNCFCQRASDVAAQTLPMAPNGKYHSRSEKSFLGVTIPANTGTPGSDLKLLLDTLANHPNVGPFLGRQLIQRLVTSNPSPAYISRVAGAFNDNGKGIRGDMKAVLRAILLDPEARLASYTSRPDYGRVREPILRLGQLMRVFNATTEQDPHSFGISPRLYDKNKGLWQAPLGSKTVFNFYLPDYQPPASQLAAQGLVAPELQITTAATVSDIDSVFQTVLENNGLTDCCSDADRNRYFMRFDYSEWVPLTTTPDILVEKMNQRFMAGQMTPRLKALVVRAVNETYQDRSQTSGIVRGLPQLRFANAMRVMMASPDYVVQK